VNRQVVLDGGNQFTGNTMDARRYVAGQLDKTTARSGLQPRRAGRRENGVIAGASPANVAVKSSRSWGWRSCRESAAVKSRGTAPVDRVEESSEFQSPVPRMTLAEDGARLHIQRRRRARRAVGESNRRCGVRLGRPQRQHGGGDPVLEFGIFIDERIKARSGGAR